MRLSADRTSPFYDAALMRNVEVFLDGQSIQNVTEAYEEVGMVRVLVYDVNRRVVLDQRRRAPRQEQRYGKVEIRLKEAASEHVRRHFEQKRQKVC
jgi:hypothetical protein